MLEQSIDNMRLSSMPLKEVKNINFDNLLNIQHGNSQYKTGHFPHMKKHGLIQNQKISKSKEENVSINYKISTKNKNLNVCPPIEKLFYPAEKCKD